MILTFIIGFGFYGFTNTSYHISNAENDYTTSERNIKLGTASFGSLAGMMCLGYYLHNCILPILKNAKNPDKNTRDVSIGFVLVFICYCVAGTIGYFGFSGAYFDSDITENALLMFDPKNVIAFIVRLSQFCQMFTVFPILFHIL